MKKKKKTRGRLLVAVSLLAAGCVGSVGNPELEGGADAATHSVDPPPRQHPTVTEACANGFDDDADGLVDEDCACARGTNARCFLGIPALAGIGACVYGRQVCVGDPEFPGWGRCEGSGQPTDEACGNQRDDDCDGAVDEGCSLEVPVDPNDAPFWNRGAWSACSATCGAGQQVQQVTCTTHAGQPVDDARCPRPKPTSSQPCTADAGCTYDWHTLAFGPCSVACGGGTQSAEVQCQRSDGTPADPSRCQRPRPNPAQPCNTQRCPSFLTTTCDALTIGQECSADDKVDGIHGDAINPQACSVSCGVMGAGCAKFVDYGSSSVCVCHSTPGLRVASSPFRPGDRHGWAVYAGNCSASSATARRPCEQQSCATTCAPMQAWRQCSSTTYFGRNSIGTEQVHGDDASPETCAASCGQMGAGCAKWVAFGNGSTTCVCLVTSGTVTSSGDLSASNTKGFRAYAADCR